MPRSDEKRARQGRPRNPYSPYNNRSQVMGEQFEQTLGNQQRNVFIQPQRDIVDQPGQLSFGNMTPGPSGGLEVLRSLAGAMTSGAQAYNAVYSDRVKRDKKKIDDALDKDYVVLRNQAVEKDANGNVILDPVTKQPKLKIDPQTGQPVALSDGGEDTFIELGSEEHTKLVEQLQAGATDFSLIDDKGRTGTHKLTIMRDLMKTSMKDNRRYVRQNMLRLGERVQGDLDRDMINEAGLAFNAANDINNPNRAEDLQEWKDRYEDFAVPGSTFAEWFQGQEYNMQQREAESMDQRMFDMAERALKEEITRIEEQGPNAIMNVTRADLEQALIDAGVYEEILGPATAAGPIDRQKFLDDYFEKFENRYRRLDNIIDGADRRVRSTIAGKVEEFRKEGLAAKTEQYKSSEHLESKLQLLDPYVDALVLDFATKNNYNTNDKEVKVEEARIREELYRDSFLDMMKKIGDNPELIQQYAADFDISLASFPTGEDFVELAARSMARRFDVNIDDETVYTEAHIEIAMEKYIKNREFEKTRIENYIIKNGGHMSQDIKDDIDLMFEDQKRIMDAQTKEEKIEVLMDMAFLTPLDSTDAFLSNYLGSDDFVNLQERLRANYRNVRLAGEVTAAAESAITGQNYQAVLADPDKKIPELFEVYIATSGIQWSAMTDNRLSVLDGNPDVFGIVDLITDEEIYDFMVDLIGPNKAREFDHTDDVQSLQLLRMGNTLKTEAEKLYGDFRDAVEKGLNAQTKAAKAKADADKLLQQKNNKIRDTKFSLGHGYVPNATSATDQAQNDMLVTVVSDAAPNAVAGIFNPNGAAANTAEGSIISAAIQGMGDVDQGGRPVGNGLVNFQELLKNGSAQDFQDFANNNPGVQVETLQDLRMLMDPMAFVRYGFNPSQYKTEVGRLGAVSMASQLIALDSSSATLTTPEGIVFNFELDDGGRQQLRESILTIPRGVADQMSIEAKNAYRMRNISISALQIHAHRKGLEASPRNVTQAQIRSGAYAGGEDFPQTDAFIDILHEDLGFSRDGALTMSVLGTVIPNFNVDRLTPEVRDGAMDLLAGLGFARNGTFKNPIVQQSYEQAQRVFRGDPTGAGLVGPKPASEYIPADNTPRMLRYYFGLGKGLGSKDAIAYQYTEQEQKSYDDLILSLAAENTDEARKEAEEGLARTIRTFEVGDQSLGLSMMAAIRTLSQTANPNGQNPALTPGQFFGMVRMPTDLAPGRSLVAEDGGLVVPTSVADLDSDLSTAGIGIKLNTTQSAATAAITNASLLQEYVVHPDNNGEYQLSNDEGARLFERVRAFAQKYDTELAAGQIDMLSGIVAAELIMEQTTGQPSQIVNDMVRGQENIKGGIKRNELVVQDPQGGEFQMPSLPDINNLIANIQMSEPMPGQGEDQQDSLFVSTVSGQQKLFGISRQNPIGDLTQHQMAVQFFETHRRVIPVQRFDMNGQNLESYIGNGRDTSQALTRQAVARRNAAGDNVPVGALLTSRTSAGGHATTAATNPAARMQQFNIERAEYVTKLGDGLVNLGFNVPKNADGVYDFSGFSNHPLVSVTLNGKVAQMRPIEALVYVQAPLYPRLAHAAHLAGVEINPEFTEAFASIEAGEVAGMDAGDPLRLDPRVGSVLELSDLQAFSRYGQSGMDARGRRGVVREELRPTVDYRDSFLGPADDDANIRTLGRATLPVELLQRLPDPRYGGKVRHTTDPEVAIETYYDVLPPALQRAEFTRVNGDSPEYYDQNLNDPAFNLDGILATGLDAAGYVSGNYVLSGDFLVDGWNFIAREMLPDMIFEEGRSGADLQIEADTSKAGRAVARSVFYAQAQGVRERDVLNDWWSFNGNANTYPVNIHNIDNLSQGIFGADGRLTFTESDIKLPLKQPPVSNPPVKIVGDDIASILGDAPISVIQSLADRGPMSEGITATQEPDDVITPSPLAPPPTEPLIPAAPPVPPAFRDVNGVQIGPVVTLDRLYDQGGPRGTTITNFVVMSALGATNGALSDYIDQTAINRSMVGLKRDGNKTNLFMQTPIEYPTGNLQREIVSSFKRELKDSQKLNSVLRSEGVKGFSKFAPKDPSKYWKSYQPGFTSDTFDISMIYDYKGYFRDWGKNIIKDDYQGESGDLFVDQTNKPALDYLDTSRTDKTFGAAMMNPDNWDINIDLDADAILQNLQDGNYRRTDNIGFGFSFNFTWEF
ncbi:hypothetical protein [uncultured virus]|uniref:Uncharacterized protein n=1 Tax=uncultured virus TaxID=340016 RepID=A0A218MKS5_9VIRU|nr:hypothetical protein [uncultured virus]